jgi:EmrB/QacA subfamily drug resistance transporter
MLSTAVRGPCDEAAIRHGAPATPCAAAAKRWVLIAAIIGSSMAFIDGTVVNVALPAVQRDLHASVFQAQWVVESYALFLAALLLVGGSLGDRFGRRRVFAIGVALFGLASLACAASREVQQLIAARAVQGVGAALLVPGSLALISATFAEGERGRAIGTWSGFSGITAALGPVLGGYLVDHGSWAWAFLINLPFALAVLAITWAHVPESRNPQAPRSLDLRGALLVTLGLGGVVYAFIEAPTQHWDAPPVRLALLGGIAALLGFVVVELRGSAPMLPLALFRNRNFAGANLLTLWLYAALGGGLFFLPLNLIQVQGYSATAAGAALLPFILIMFVLSRWAGRLVDTVGPRIPLVIGPLIAAAGFALLALPSTGGSYWRSFLPGIVVLGLGMTVTVAPLTTTVMNAVGPDAAGTASGVNNAVSRVAALLAIAVFGGVMAWAFQGALDEALRAAALPDELIRQVQAQRSRLAAVELPSDIDPTSAAAVHRAVADAFVNGFRWVMGISAALAVASALAAALSISGPPRPMSSGQRRAAPKRPA